MHVHIFLHHVHNVLYYMDVLWHDILQWAGLHEFGLHMENFATCYIIAWGLNTGICVPPPPRPKKDRRPN